MSQKQARRNRQALRSTGVDTFPPKKVPNRMHPTALKWFLEEQAAKRAAAEAKPKRKTRSQVLAEEVASE